MTLGDEIARLKARLDALRPLVGPSLEVLDRWYDVELTYTSNAIEGSSLTRSETAIVVEKGLTIGGKRLRDHLEALDHMDALAFVRRLAGLGERLREGDVRAIHQLVLMRSDPDEAGEYSRRQRAISGSNVRFPAPAAIPPLMAEFAAWLGETPASAGTAFEAHYRFVTIHPFSDGNGRTARLLMNLVLLQAGYPPAAIGPQERARYLDALELRQSGGDPEPWRTLMAERLLASLARYVEHAESALKPGPARPG